MTGISFALLNKIDLGLPLCHVTDILAIRITVLLPRGKLSFVTKFGEEVDDVGALK